MVKKIDETAKTKAFSKKILIYIIILLIVILACYLGSDYLNEKALIVKKCNSHDYCVSFCESASEMMKYVSIILNLIRVLIPPLIILFGLYKLNKVKKNKKSSISQIEERKREFLASIAIGVTFFYLPVIILTGLKVISAFENQDVYDVKSFDFYICEKCLLNPFKCK